MARYNLIKIGTVYLTSDGLVTGRPCKTEVSGLEALLLEYAGNTVKSADNTPYTFLMEYTGQGAEIRILVSVVEASVADAIKAIVNTALSGPTPINIVIEGDLGDFDLQCDPLFRDSELPIMPNGRFRNGRLFDVAYNFTVVSFTPPGP